MGIDIPIIQTQGFADVDPDAWFHPYVEIAKKKGWIDGYPDGLFRPGNTINRAEIAKILVNAFGFAAPNYQVDLQWYDRYVRVLEGDALLPYHARSDFEPGLNPTRAEISEQLHRFMTRTGRLAGENKEKFKKIKRLISDQTGQSVNSIHLSIPFASDYHIRGTYWFSHSTINRHTFLARNSDRTGWELAYWGEGTLLCDLTNTHGFSHSMLSDCIKEEGGTASGLPVGNFEFNESGNFLGEFYVRGYLEKAEVMTPFCEHDDCEMFTGVGLVITETGNQKFSDFLEKNKTPDYQESKFGIGCLRDDGTIRYANDSDAHGMREVQIIAEHVRKMFTATPQNQKVFRLNKMSLSGGRGAPACYSHFSNIEMITDDTSDNTIPISRTGRLSEKVILEVPEGGQHISSPLVVKARVPGNWLFEATAPLVLTDWDGRIIAKSYLRTGENWMTTELVPVSGTIIFDVPKNIYSRNGTLILRRHNASDLPEHDAAVEVPVVFE